MPPISRASSATTATDPSPVQTDSMLPTSRVSSHVSSQGASATVVVPVEQCRPESLSGRSEKPHQPSFRGASTVDVANTAVGAQTCEKRELSVQELRSESWSERQIAQHRHVRTWLVSRALTGTMGAMQDGGKRSVAGMPGDAQILTVA